VEKNENKQDKYEDKRWMLLLAVAMESSNLSNH
jgi:hypothetical protein